MRLINVKTREFEEFFEPEIPRYAILSHTWGEGEVSYDDYLRPGKFAQSKAGYSKIDNVCRIARRQKLKYAWVDTCCIDKRSSAELSEAINSMYRWYRDCEACLVYLSDVDPPSPPEHDSPGQLYGHVGVPLEQYREQFQRCRWFTRGWTLQELLAPNLLLFFSKSWRLLDDYDVLLDDIVAISSIPREVLDRTYTSNAIQRWDALQGMSIAQRMSWAAGRISTRVEDGAYCLLGLFGINIPMLYGEGSRAFIRLQQEIIKQSNDHSIFAWTRGIHSSIFAPSPECFSQFHLMASSVPSTAVSYTYKASRHFHLTNSGLRLTLPCLDTPDPDIRIAVLNCGTSPSRDRRLCVVMQREADEGVGWCMREPFFVQDTGCFKALLESQCLKERKMYAVPPGSQRFSVHVWNVKPSYCSVFVAFPGGGGDVSVSTIYCNEGQQRIAPSAKPARSPAIITLSRRGGETTPRFQILRFHQPDENSTFWVMVLYDESTGYSARWLGAGTGLGGKLRTAEYALKRSERIHCEGFQWELQSSDLPHLFHGFPLMILKFPTKEQGLQGQEELAAEELPN